MGARIRKLASEEPHDFDDYVVSGWYDNLEIESLSQLGGTVAIRPYSALAPAGLGIGPSSDAVWVPFKTPQVSTVTFWADAVGYVVIITVDTGNIEVTKRIACPLVPTSMQVFGRMVRVSFAALQGALGTNCHAALSPFAVDPLANLFPLWFPTNVLANQGGIYVPSALNGNNAAGLMGSAQGFLAPNTSAGTYYLMFFDANALPLNGTPPLLAIGPLQPGAPFSFDQSVRPTIRFTSGLYWALSSTGDTLTIAAPAAGGARVDAGVLV